MKRVIRHLEVGRSKKGQVWVETVIYTLIGLAVIGILLAIAKPKIDSIKDKMTISRSIDSMNLISDKIYEVQRAPGNRRVVEMKISNGRFIIDSENDELKWILDSDYQYSETGESISLGNMNILTEEGSPWTVTLSAGYPVDLRYDNQTTGVKEFEAAPTNYIFYIENIGKADGGNLIIDIRE